MSTVIITGASRGIGEACARRFAADGTWNLVLTCSASEKALLSLGEELSSLVPGLMLSVGDIADESYTESLFREAEERFGIPDVVICNAGTAWYGLLQDMTMDEYHRVIDTNLTGTFLCAKYAIPRMLKNKAGSILNVSSVWGSHGASCESVYAASKGAVEALTRSLAKELGPSGIRVNAAAFGLIDTSMNAHLSSEDIAALTDEIPLGREGSPAEAADLLYALAVRHPYLTGQVVSLDGGWLV